MKLTYSAVSIQHKKCYQKNIRCYGYNMSNSNSSFYVLLSSHAEDTSSDQTRNCKTRRQIQRKIPRGLLKEIDVDGDTVCDVYRMQSEKYCTGSCHTVQKNSHMYVCTACKRNFQYTVQGNMLYCKTLCDNE